MTKSALVLATLAACGGAATTTVRAPAPSPTVTATATATATATPTATATASVPPPPPATGPVFERGFASWYGQALAGNHTASGEIFDPALLTAAHRTLELGTLVEVRRTDNGRYVRVKVNDRGPVSHRFIIDLSSGAARALGMLRMGVAPVEIRILARPPPRRKKMR